MTELGTLGGASPGDGATSAVCPFLPFFAIAVHVCRRKVFHTWAATEGPALTEVLDLKLNLFTTQATAPPTTFEYQTINKPTFVFYERALLYV